MIKIIDKTKSKIKEYINGNYKVTIYSDGTKVREVNDTIFIPNFPESIDIKITNYCDKACDFCHENSTIKGIHCDKDILLTILKDLPEGVELAIGGGNPLSHPDIIEILTKCKENGLICNITINQDHINSYKELLLKLIQTDLIKGLGISITNADDLTGIISLQDITQNIVFHVIIGILTINDILKLQKLKYCKLLILGYKEFGRGINHNINIRKSAKLLLSHDEFFNNTITSFDNLAIEQLELQTFITKEVWDKGYMGDDFTFSMYVDAVKQEYAPTSRSNTRIPFSYTDLLTYFKLYRDGRNR